MASASPKRKGKQRLESISADQTRRPVVLEWVFLGNAILSGII